MQELVYIDTSTINPLPSHTSDNPGTKKPQECHMPFASPLLYPPFSGPPAEILTSLSFYFLMHKTWVIPSSQLLSVRFGAYAVCLACLSQMKMKIWKHLWSPPPLPLCSLHLNSAWQTLCKILVHYDFCDSSLQGSWHVLTFIYFPRTNPPTQTYLLSSICRSERRSLRLKNSQKSSIGR